MTLDFKHLEGRSYYAGGIIRQVELLDKWTYQTDDLIGHTNNIP